MQGGRAVISDGCRHMPLHAAAHLYPPSAMSTHQVTDGPVESAGASSSVLEVAIRIRSIVQSRFGSPAPARVLQPSACSGAHQIALTNADGVKPGSMRC